MRGNKLRRPAAVLWDLDGTIIDTEPLWMAAEYDLVNRHGGTWNEKHSKAIVGSDLVNAGGYIREHAGVDLEAHEIVEDLVGAVLTQMATDLRWRPGALELLGALHIAEVPLGLVTMSYRSIVDALLPHLPEGIFDIVVTGDEVTAGKPDPEPYLAAARALAVDPARCVAIEDSPTGTAAAEAAGCHVLVVPNQVAVAPAPGRTLAQSLVGIGVADLAALLG